MSSSFGKQIEISIFGESHGPTIGVVINNLPAGEELSSEYIQNQLNRRAPGKDSTATARHEGDMFQFLSGVKYGKTTGAPLCAIIKNEDTRSGDYSEISDCPRPSHADYTAHVRYSGFNDVSGSGHFSGRLTAPLVIAGAICRQILARRGVIIGGHVLSIGQARDESFDYVNISANILNDLSNKYFATIETTAEDKMREVIRQVHQSSDSIGGIVEIAVTGLPAGLGSPMFGGVENIVSAAVYGVPAVKGIEFGAGFDFSNLTGSAANDSIYLDGDTVKTTTNNCGGIVGGITNGMPLILKAALKPTPSIGIIQSTINLKTKENTTLQIKGRHDPCIVPRALPAIESAVAVALINLMAEGYKL